jgi:hypothetical protein
MWEQKRPDCSWHHNTGVAQWSASGSAPDGNLFLTLSIYNDTNGGGKNCFAGYCDWRLPTANELAALLDISACHGICLPDVLGLPVGKGGAFDPFNDPCDAADNVNAVADGTFWSSTPFEKSPLGETIVNISIVPPPPQIDAKTSFHHYIAVRDLGP